LHPILLDGRGAKTPGGTTLAAPGRALAELIAGEWASQDTWLDPSTMPLTRLAATAIDRTPVARADIVGEIVRYAETDLICYRAEEPQALADREAAAWDPWLTWIEAELGVRLSTTRGIVHAPQPPASLERLRRVALELDPWRLTGIAHLTALSGSAVLAVGVAKGALTAVEAFELSRLNEKFQAARWGEDEEARARTEALRGEARQLDRWLWTLDAA
jgi:chaperone required for assembly of F1-ATPase